MRSETLTSIYLVNVLQTFAYNFTSNEKKPHHTSVVMLQDISIVMGSALRNISTWYFLERL